MVPQRRIKVPYNYVVFYGQQFYAGYSTRAAALQGANTCIRGGYKEIVVYKAQTKVEHKEVPIIESPVFLADEV